MKIKKKKEWREAQVYLKCKLVKKGENDFLILFWLNIWRGWYECSKYVFYYINSWGWRLEPGHLYYKHQKMSVKLQGSWPLSTQLFLLLSFIFSCQNITFCPFKIRLCSFWSINFFPISFWSINFLWYSFKFILVVICIMKILM